MSVAVILGSAFHGAAVQMSSWDSKIIKTSDGDVTLYRYPRKDGDAWVLFRHGLPHRFLPHQIPYRAHTLALKEVGVESLLVTSSVGVLDASLPLDQPLLLSDLIMLENRMPDGSACSIFDKPHEHQGHLVLDEGLFSKDLTGQIQELCVRDHGRIRDGVVFGFTLGPRTKTAAENGVWFKLGAQVNSMTLAPEVVLANECEIPTAGLVIGHKYSLVRESSRVAAQDITAALSAGRVLFEKMVLTFLEQGVPVKFKNHIYRF